MAVVIQPQVPDGNKKEYVLGGHSAALDEDFGGSIAEFLLADEIPATLAHSLSMRPEREAHFVLEQSVFVKVFGKVPFAVWLGILLIVAGLFYGLLKLPVREWVRTLILFAYVADGPGPLRPAGRGCAARRSPRHG
jgi:hypothetical protein